MPTTLFQQNRQPQSLEREALGGGDVLPETWEEEARRLVGGGGEPPVLFNFYAPIIKAAVEELPEGDWLVKGPLTNPDWDLQREKMTVKGLKTGLGIYAKLGRPVDWHHLWEKTGEPKWLIGRGVEIFDAPHPNNPTVNVPWMVTRLFKEKEVARQAMEHLLSGGELGYSVCGGALKRNPGQPGEILQSFISSVAITPVPIVSENRGTLAIMKALDAYRRGEGGIRPIVQLPELYEITLAPFAKALLVTGGLPAGPGADALKVEDLGGGPAASRRKKKRRIGDGGGRLESAELAKSLESMQLAYRLEAMREVFHACSN
jgi:hypothetical protein